MKISIGSDHAGFDYKEVIIKFLEEKSFTVQDFGTHSSESVDYPDFAHPVSKEVNDNEDTMGILICGSGNGVSIAANKHSNVRAALCWNEEISSLARLHNNANICSLPARFIDLDTAKKIVETFLTTEFEGGRHQRRVGKISFC